MGGFKNEGQVVHGETEKGDFDPEPSDLNFAIPSVEILREFCPYGDDNSKPRKPGTYVDIMEKAAEVLHDHSAVYIVFWSFEISDNILRNHK